MAPNDNLSLVISKKDDLKLMQTPIPDIGPNDVLCKTHSVGICGTDIHFWKDGHLGSFVVNAPMVLGHEVSALVVKVGANVTNLKSGDRVAIEPAVPCRMCMQCKLGLYNLCDISNRQARGCPPYDGCLRRYFAHPSDFCFKLPDNVSWEEGALVEPLAVCVHAVRRVNVTVGQTVLVCGSGTMGICCMATAKAYGASKVIMTDVNANRLAIAKSLGADETILIDPKNYNVENIVKEVKSHLNGNGADICLECTGMEGSTQVGIYATANGGKVALVGLGPSEISAPLVNASLREVDIIGVCRFRNDFPTAIYLLESGKVNIKSIATHKYPLENALQAFEKMIEPNGDSLKVMITCNQDFN